MDGEALERILRDVRSGKLSVARALERLRASPPLAELGFATVDHHRELRQGHPEIIYAPGKTPAQLVRIGREIHRRSGRLLATRVDAAQARALRKAVRKATYQRVARTVSVLPPRRARKAGVAIVSAGTADQAVAEEARVACRYLGHEPEMLTDVGVAGLHRLLHRAEALRRARVVIAVAGMEGALASVVGGLVDAPVIGVPTSVGYGAGAGGLAPLLSMLNSCAANVCCVNIDSGVGAAVVAAAINRQ